MKKQKETISCTVYDSEDFIYVHYVLYKNCPEIIDREQYYTDKYPDYLRIMMNKCVKKPYMYYQHVNYFYGTVYKRENEIIFE